LCTVNGAGAEVCVFLRRIKKVKTTQATTRARLKVSIVARQ
jgi:hypothetical protein